jgi:hypothetical protein
MSVANTPAVQLYNFANRSIAALKAVMQSLLFFLLLPTATFTPRQSKEVAPELAGWPVYANTGTKLGDNHQLVYAVWKGMQVTPHHRCG